MTGPITKQAVNLSELEATNIVNAYKHSHEKTTDDLLAAIEYSMGSVVEHPGMAFVIRDHLAAAILMELFQ